MMLLEENDQERTMLSMLNIIQKSLLQNFFFLDSEKKSDPDKRTRIRNTALMSLNSLLV